MPMPVRCRSRRVMPDDTAGVNATLPLVRATFSDSFSTMEDAMHREEGCHNMTTDRAGGRGGRRGGWGEKGGFGEMMDQRRDGNSEMESVKECERGREEGEGERRVCVVLAENEDTDKVKTKNRKKK